jgi:hypothetical protein
MRTFLVVAVLAGLTFFFVVQKRQESATPQTVAAEATSPRPVSEHNWMKRSLDTTNDLKRKVAQQRKEDGTR